MTGFGDACRNALRQEKYPAFSSSLRTNDAESRNAGAERAIARPHRGIYLLRLRASKSDRKYSIADEL